MLTIRLQRRGRKNDPSFRVIVVESKRAPKSGDYLEMVGSYDPRVDRIDLKPERIKHWIAEGAQVSDTVHNLLVSQKVIDGKKINVLPRKSPPAVEAAAPSDSSASAPGTEEAVKDSPENAVIAETAAPAADSGDSAVAPEPENP